MKKTIKIIIGVIVILLVVAIIAGVIVMNSKPKTNLEPVNSAEDLSALVDKIYEGENMQMQSLMTQVVETSDVDYVKTTTGLENADDIEYVVASDPMMTAQAYSLVLVKVKDGVDANSIAKTMNENVNARKWICVAAEKIYTTSSGNIVCLVMASDEIAKPVYEKFKTLAGEIGQEYERTYEEPEMPEDMY